jgi:hypothetical protein
LRRRSLVGDQASDLAMGVLSAAAIVVATHRIEPSGGDRVLDALAYGCMVVAGASLAGRRRWPLAVVVVVSVASAVYLGRGYVGGPVFLTLFVSFYSLATGRGRRLAFGATAVTCPPTAGLATTKPHTR